MLRLIWGLLCCLSSSLLAQPEWIYYPRPGDDAKAHAQFPVQLLELAFAKAGEKNYHLTPSTDKSYQGRTILELLLGRSNIRVMWTMTSLERETQLLPIRIPIDKGLFGWRIALLHASRAELFQTVSSLSDLAKFRAGQGYDWPDTTILRSNQLPVEPVTGEGLFDMLALDRFDYFPRSILEVWPEAESYASTVEVDPYLVIYYPTALYYFVNRKDAKLGAIIQTGLEKAIADGSFDRLFDKFYAAYIQRAKLHERRILRLKNPLLPPLTPIDRKALWLDPERYRRLNAH